MRWLVWSATIVLFACGRSKTESAEPAGGTGGTGGTVSSGAGGTGTGGNGTGGTTPAGGSSATGGSPAAGHSSAGTSGNQSSGGEAGIAANAGHGTGGATAGQATSTGGASTGGDAGEAGSAGSTGKVCEGEYLACGCGCCPDQYSFACYYPDRGDSLTTIASEDRAVAMSPSCENAGCGVGIGYTCCQVPPVDPDATYEVTSFGSGLLHLLIERTGADGVCGSLSLIYPSDAEPGFPLDLPERWGLNSTEGSTCNMEDGRGAMGAIGSVSFTTPDRCTLDFDFTLFLAGRFEAVRFKASGVPVPADLASPNCP